MTENIGIKIVSLFVAMVLWFVVLGSQGVEITKELPVEVQTSDEVALSNELPERVSVRLAVPKAFVRAMVNSNRDVPIKVNLTGAKAGNVRYQFLPEHLALPLGVRVLSFRPTHLDLRLEPVKTKKVPVILRLRGAPAEGYKVTHSEVTPNTMTLKGAKSVLQRVREVNTFVVDLADRKQPFDGKVSIELTEPGLVLEEGEEVDFNVKVEPVSANFKIKNVGIKVRSAYQAKLNIPNVTIYVRATADELAGLDHSQVFAEIDMRGKSKGRYDKQSVEIIVPEHIGVVKVVPETVQVTLY